MSADAPTVRIWKHLTDGYFIRVMAVAENWVMARRKGCAPFVLTLRELHHWYQPKGGRDES